jgi:hypothetical protein
MSPVAEAYYPLTLMLVYSNIRNQLQGYNIETKLMELCSSRSAICTGSISICLWEMRQPGLSFLQ